MTCCPECLGALEYWAGSDKSAHAGWYCKSGGCPNNERKVLLYE